MGKCVGDTFFYLHLENVCQPVFCSEKKKRMVRNEMKILFFQYIKFNKLR